VGDPGQDQRSDEWFFHVSAYVNEVRNQGCLRAGFKLLLDLLLSTDQPLKIKELPYHFRLRQAGESKLTTQVAWRMVLLILDKKFGHIIPARFVSFTLVGSVGVVVHFLALILVYKLLGSDFILGQAVATLVAMTSNFLLNNLSTFSDRSLHGWSLLRGWMSFVAACSIGAVANVGIAGVLFSQDVDWVLSALAGALVGSVWNYATTAVYTWKTG
jgi:dolichol-phosphate mannosyltransferase